MSCHHNARTRLPRNRSSFLKHLTRLFFFFHFLWGSLTLREIERAFPERFLARLGLSSATQLEQAGGAVRLPAAHHRRESASTQRKNRVPSSCRQAAATRDAPDRQDERDRFVMGIDEQQNVSSRIGSPSKIEDIASVAAQHHPKTTYEWRRPFFSLISFPPGLNHITS